MFFEQFSANFQQKNVLRTQTLDELAREVILEVETLLNTRRITFEGVKGTHTGAIGFGMPDFQHLSLARREDVNYLESAIRYAVNTFEPRLSNVKVIIDTKTSRGSLVNITLEAELRLGEQLELISFHVFVPNAEPGKRRRKVDM